MLIQQIINGLTLGSIYALIALGYTMVYGIIQLINFAHGEVLMMGAFVALLLWTNLGLNFFVSLALAAIFSALLGVAIERFAYRPLRNSPRLAALITALGMSIFLQNLAMILWGTHPHAFPDPFDGRRVNLLGTELSFLQLLIFLGAILLMIILHFFVSKTRLGRAMRATAEDKDAAALMGISVNGIIALTFAIGSALAAVAGVMVGAYYHSAYPTMGYFTGLKAFAAAVLGGIGNMPGAMLGGITLGLVEILGIAGLAVVYRVMGVILGSVVLYFGLPKFRAFKYNSYVTRGTIIFLGGILGYFAVLGLERLGFSGIPSGYQDAISFAVLILVLIFKPSGLMGERLSEKV